MRFIRLIVASLTIVAISLLPAYAQDNHNHPTPPANNAAKQLQTRYEVTTTGATTWRQSIQAKPGDALSWRFYYKHTGTANIDKLVIKTPMPAHQELVKGSVTWFDGNHPNGFVFSDTGLFNQGLNLGKVAPGGDGYVRFRTTVSAHAACGTSAKIAGNLTYDGTAKQHTLTFTTSACAAPAPPPSDDHDHTPQPAPTTPKPQHAPTAPTNPTPPTDHADEHDDHTTPDTSPPSAPQTEPQPATTPAHSDHQDTPPPAEPTQGHVLATTTEHDNHTPPPAPAAPTPSPSPQPQSDQHEHVEEGTVAAQQTENLPVTGFNPLYIGAFVAICGATWHFMYTNLAEKYL
jgi:hypothetical protein